MCRFIQGKVILFLIRINHEPDRTYINLMKKFETMINTADENLAKELIAMT